MSNLVNLPDSFGSIEEAREKLAACCELAGIEVKMSDHLPPKHKVFLMCKALEHDYLDILERVKRGRDER